MSLVPACLLLRSMGLTLMWSRFCWSGILWLERIAGRFANYGLNSSRLRFGLRFDCVSCGDAHLFPGGHCREPTTRCHGSVADNLRQVRRKIPGDSPRDSGKTFSNSGKKLFVVFCGFRGIMSNSGKFAAKLREVRRKTPEGSPHNSGRFTANLREVCAFPREVCLLGVCAGISRVGACAQYQELPRESVSRSALFGRRSAAGYTSIAALVVLV